MVLVLLSDAEYIIEPELLGNYGEPVLTGKLVQAYRAGWGYIFRAGDPPSIILSSIDRLPEAMRLAWDSMEWLKEYLEEEAYDEEKPEVESQLAEFDREMRTLQEMLKATPSEKAYSDFGGVIYSLVDDSLIVSDGDTKYMIPRIPGIRCSFTRVKLSFDSLLKTPDQTVKSVRIPINECLWFDGSELLDIAGIQRYRNVKTVVLSRGEYYSFRIGQSGFIKGINTIKGDLMEMLRRLLNYKPPLLVAYIKGDEVSARYCTTLACMISTIDEAGDALGYLNTKKVLRRIISSELDTLSKRLAELVTILKNVG